MAIIEKMDGSRYDMTKYGFPQLKIGPIDIIYDSENIKGRPGRNRTSRYHGVRKIQLKMSLQAINEADTIFIRDKLAEIFDDAEDFYIYEQVGRPYEFEFPGQTEFKSAIEMINWTPHLFKRWRVERINNDAIEWDGLKGRRVIEFETSDLPYGETPFTSLELGASAKEWGSEMLAWGIGLDWTENLPQYRFTNANTFTVKNIGNVKVDPRYMPLKITIKGVFTMMVDIYNLTTGDHVRVNTGLTATDTLVLDGVDYLKNGSSVIDSSNLNLITLAKGDNEFRIYGGGATLVEIEHPFYFL